MQAPPPPVSERPDEHPRSPATPADLGARRWRAVLKRTVVEFRDDNLTDSAAALTYYAVLSLFPALIVLVSMLGVLGRYPQTFDALMGIVRELGPESAVDTFAGPVEGVIRRKGTAGTLLGVGTAAAVWTASAYVGGFIRASNAIYEVEEGRPFWKLRPLQIAVTLVALVMVALVALALVLTGPVLDATAGAIGLGDEATTAFSIAKWPLAVVVVTLMIALLYWVAPNVRQPRFRWVTPGGAVAVVAWAVLSAGFAFYVANFGSYDRTYGTLGGVVVFLLWLWLSNLALLFGAELDAEIERGRELEAGLPAKRQLQLPAREPAER